MPLLITLMRDEFVAVKDTAAWNIGRVCELNSEAALKDEYLQPLLEALVSGMYVFCLIQKIHEISI